MFEQRRSLAVGMKQETSFFDICVGDRLVALGTCWGLFGFITGDADGFGIGWRCSLVRFSIETGLTLPAFETGQMKILPEGVDHLSIQQPEASSAMIWRNDGGDGTT